MANINIIIVYVICGYIGLSAASVCKPDSTFKIDCNTCSCSRTGREYSCTNFRCPPPNYSNFDIVRSSNGYLILKPKNNDANYIPEDNDVVLPRINRKVRVPVPYVDDEIPSEDDESVNQYYNKINNDIDDQEGDSEEGQYVDEDLEESKRESPEYTDEDDYLPNWQNIVPRRDVIN